MPPKYTSLPTTTPTFPETTITPEEQAERQAKNLLYEYGYLHSDSTIPFNVVVHLLKQTILKNRK